jgi:general secretion pathway protein J
MDLRSRGFTLVEILVASTIGAFIALVAVGTLRAVTGSTEIVDSGITTAAEVRFASNTIARDLVNLYRDKNKANTKLIGTVIESGQGDISYLILYTTSRTKARVGQPEGDIYEVEYYLLQDEGTGGASPSRLMRRFWPNPNEEYEPGGILSVIAERIEVFEVRYFDGEEWSNEWPEEMQTLPRLIEVNIAGQQVGRGGPIMESFIVNFARPASGGNLTVGSEGESGSAGASGGTSSGESPGAGSGESGAGSDGGGQLSPGTVSR